MYAGALLVLGVVGAILAHDAISLRLLALPGLFFGGAALFCSIFALREPRHGLSGVSFLSFIAVLTTAARLFSLLSAGKFRWPPANQAAVLLNGALLVVSLAFLAMALQVWRRLRAERARAVLEAD